MSDSAPPPDSSSENGDESGSPPQGSPPPNSKSAPPPPAASSNATSKAPPPPPPSSNESNSSPPTPPPPSPRNAPSPPPPPAATSHPPPPSPKSNSPPPPPSDPPSSSAPPPSSSSSSSSNDPDSPPPPPLDNQSSASPPPPPSPPPTPKESPSPSVATPLPPNSLPATPSPPSTFPDLAPPVATETPSGSSPPTPSIPKATPATQNTPMKPSRSISSDTTPSNSAPSRHANSSSSTPSSSKGSSDSSNTSGNGVVVGLSVAGIVVVLVAAFILFSRKKRRRVDGLATHYMPPSTFSVRSDGYYYNNPPMGSSSHSDSFYASKPPISPASGNPQESYRGHGYQSGQIDPSGSKSWFSYEELMDITNGFSHENLLGEGGFGCVYKGWLSDGRTVAVKQLKAGSGQGEREFRAEVEIISRVHHRHLVSLVGFCIAEAHRLLVYEFVPNNTLEHHLHGKGVPVLDWPKRLKIAIGSARGLAYLHEDCHPRIIHRDIKSANILLEDSFEAQVADFGLAKLSNDTHTHVSTRVMGTFGYMAPEYASSGKLTDRSDVFSFGVVLLELITGRKPVDPSQPLGDESLVEWARPRLVHALETGNYEDVVDARLEYNFAKNEMFRMVETAAACVRHSAPKRPRMAQVVRALDTEDDMSDLSNGVKFGQSTVFDSGQYSADIQKFRKMAFGSPESSSDYGYSEEHERRSAVQSGEFRSREAPSRPPQSRPGEHSSGEHQSREMPPRPPNQWRPVDQYSSGEYQSDHESETRAINHRATDRSSGGSYRYNGRGFP